MKSPELPPVTQEIPEDKEQLAQEILARTKEPGLSLRAVDFVEKYIIDQAKESGKKFLEAVRQNYRDLALNKESAEEMRQEFSQWTLNDFSDIFWIMYGERLDRREIEDRRVVTERRINPDRRHAK